MAVGRGGTGGWEALDWWGVVGCEKVGRRMKNFEEEDCVAIWEVEGWGVIERSGIGARTVSLPAPKVLLMSRLLFLNTSFSLPVPDVEDDALGVDPNHLDGLENQPDDEDEGTDVETSGDRGRAGSGQSARGALDDLPWRWLRTIVACYLMKVCDGYEFITIAQTPLNLHPPMAESRSTERGCKRPGLEQAKRMSAID